MDVVVIDERGTPVSRLQQQDFEVREDGEPVETATFTAVDLPQAPAGERPAADREQVAAL